MPLPKMGLNLTGLENLPELNLSLPTSGEEIVNDAPKVANSSTGNIYGLVVLFALFIFSYRKLSDMSQFGDFKYSKIRSAGIAGGMCCILGLVNLALGYFTNYYHVVIFGGIWLLATIWILF